MGFRDYAPGLNRFLTLDLYNGALSDLSLTADPWTNNRYAFGAGNPLSQVEIDGHGWFDDAADWVKDNGSDLGHAALDVAGLVPVVGEAADLANAAWYTSEGDYANAALSAAAAIPFAGWGASAVKAGKYAVKGADAIQGATKAADAGANGAKTAPAPKPAPKAGSGSGGQPSGAGGGKAGGTASTGKQASGSGSGGGKAANGGGTSATTGRGACKNSFTPDTGVLMGDGSRKPIEDVKMDDLVTATDPETGLTVARPVTALIVGDGDKHLVEISVDVDGPAGDSTGVVVATDEHPFWIDDQGRWVYAKDLRQGDHVVEADGRPLEVLATHQWVARQRTNAPGASQTVWRRDNLSGRQRLGEVERRVLAGLTADEQAVFRRMLNPRRSGRPRRRLMHGRQGPSGHRRERPAESLGVGVGDMNARSWEGADPASPCRGGVGVRR